MRRSLILQFQTSKADDTLVQNVQTLKAFVTPPKTVIFKFIAQKLTNLSVAIAGTEVVSKANSTIASVPINAQATHLVLSTGIGFSNLRLNTFATSTVISGGQPVMNNGTAETNVTGNSTDFSVIAPLVLVSYRINRRSNARWETRCPNGCSFLVGGGVGANLTSKEADFDIGPSIEIDNVLFTPALHIGRETRLADGVTVGENPSPASTLPTNTKTVFKWAITITYSIPLPNF